MIMSGDLKKIQDSLNKVLIPMGERIEALEAKVKELEEAKAKPKAAPKAS